MTYNPTKKVLQITPSEADSAAAHLLYAIRKIRVAHKLPLHPYKTDEELSDADLAMKGILDAATHLGLDLGGRWGNELDVTNAG